MALLVWLACAATGLLLTLAWDRTPGRLAERAAAGAAIGVTLLGLGAAALSPLLGFATASAVALALLFVIAAAAARTGLSALRPQRPAATSALLGLAGAALVAVPLARAVWIADDGLYTGADHNLGDLPFHLGIVHAFLAGDGRRLEHPELSGVALTYSWSIDAAAAAAAAIVGVEPATALRTQGMSLGAALVVLMWTWGRELTGSRWGAALVPGLALFNGGLGAFRLMAEKGDLAAVGAALANPLHDVTIYDPWGLRWGNTFAVLLIPQRAFLLGLPLGLYASLLAWRALDHAAASREERRALTGAGVVLGLLPLAHAHSFVATALSLGVAGLLFRRPSFVRVLALAALLAVPQVLALATGSGTGLGHFVALQTGWDRGAQPAVGFWIQNAAPFLPLALVAFAWLRRERVARFLAGAGLLFVVPNLLRLSPWIWDNIKLLYWAQVAAAPLVALLLVRIAARGRAAALLATLLFLASLASGAVDTWRIARGRTAHRLFDAHAMSFAREITRATAPGARLLTAPTHDHPALLSGRPQYLGYEGHIWSQGLDAGSRRARIEAAFAGDPSAWRALRAEGVTAVVVGPRERASFPAAEATFRAERLIARAGPWSLYALDPR